MTRACGVVSMLAGQRARRGALAGTNDSHLGHIKAEAIGVRAPGHIIWLGRREVDNAVADDASAWSRVLLGL